MAIFEVDEENYNQVMSEEFSKGKVVLLKFGSEFCDECSALDMELDLLDGIVENLSIISIDCNQALEIAEEYDIYQLPTMFIYKDIDNIIYKSEGVTLAEDIKEIIESKL